MVGLEPVQNLFFTLALFVVFIVIIIVAIIVINIFLLKLILLSLLSLFIAAFIPVELIFHYFVFHREQVATSNLRFLGLVLQSLQFQAMLLFKKYYATCYI